MHENIEPDYGIEKKNIMTLLFFYYYCLAFGARLFKWNRLMFPSHYTVYELFFLLLCYCRIIKFAFVNFRRGSEAIVDSGGVVRIASYMRSVLRSWSAERMLMLSGACARANTNTFIDHCKLYLLSIVLNEIITIIMCFIV